jgi:hypothetical protein
MAATTEFHTPVILCLSSVVAGLQPKTARPILSPGGETANIPAAIISRVE